MSHAAATEMLTVAVASSLYQQMQLDVLAFEKKYAIKVRLISGSTGRLYNQIIQGAPFDVFIAADKQRPALLMQQGRSLSQHVMGQAYVALQVANGFHQDLKILKQKNIRHIAIASPDVAPFGQAAKAVLQQHGLWKDLKPKLVYAQNALQAQMMLNKGLVDAAFVATGQESVSLARIPYIGVLLSQDERARQWLQHFSLSETVGR
ncbi:MAG: molybdate ABC transporter substrate-binding protein [Mariprofundaceae bacterium]|nr:molybdate ABC transporter substrate-binding protein [Mariprofundaceae bacterium]